MTRPFSRALALAVGALALAACGPRASGAQSPQAPQGTASAQSAAAAPAAPAGADQALFSKAGFDVPTKQIVATDFTLASLDGSRVSLSSYRGKTVVLSFWATWCVPCQTEMPEMQRLYESLRSRGFEIVAVDVMEQKQTVEKFRRDHGYTFPMLLDTDGAIATLYGAQGIPTNYVIDAQGMIRGRVVGVGGPSWTSPEMKALFDKLLSS